MNSYGRTALAYWSTAMPEQVALMPDPRRHFTDLGELVGQQVCCRYDALVLSAPRTVGHRTRRAALEQLLAKAEAEVMGELVYTDRPLGSVTAEEPEDAQEFRDRIVAGQREQVWLGAATQTQSQDPGQLHAMTDTQIRTVLDAAGPGLRDALTATLAALRESGPRI